MKMIYNVISILVLGSMLLIPVGAFAQINIDYDNCMVVSSQQTFYWPFEVKTTHEPAIAQRITDRHANAPDAQIGIDKPQSSKAEDATWIAFRNSQNVTATWEVQLDLEYLHEKEERRWINVDIFSNNQNVQNLKLEHMGKTTCIVYNLQVTDPPHDWTDEEIIAVGASLTKDEFTSLKLEQSRNNKIVGDGQTFDNIQTVVFGGAVVMLILKGWKDRDKIKAELALIRWEREQLELARMALQMNDEYREVKVLQALKQMAIEKTRIYGDVIAMVQLGLSKGFNEIEKFFVTPEEKIDDKLIPSSPTDLAQVTFADMENPLCCRCVFKSSAQVSGKWYCDEHLFELSQSRDPPQDLHNVPNWCTDHSCKKYSRWHPNESCIFNDPSDPEYIPAEFVEYDIFTEHDMIEPETPGLKERLGQIKSKLPFQKKEVDKSFEEYTEDYLREEIKDMESKDEQVKHLKVLWDKTLVESLKDPLGVASRELEVIRKVWKEVAYE
jgi:hypothetical protein